MAREIMASTDAPAFFADGPVDTVLQVAVPVPLGRGDVLVYDYYPPQPAVNEQAHQTAPPPVQRGTIIKVSAWQPVCLGYCHGVYTDAADTARQAKTCSVLCR